MKIPKLGTPKMRSRSRSPTLSPSPKKLASTVSSSKNSVANSRPSFPWSKKPPNRVATATRRPSSPGSPPVHRAPSPRMAPRQPPNRVATATRRQSSRGSPPVHHARYANPTNSSQVTDTHMYASVSNPDVYMHDNSTNTAIGQYATSTNPDDAYAGDYSTNPDDAYPEATYDGDYSTNPEDAMYDQSTNPDTAYVHDHRSELEEEPTMYDHSNTIRDDGTYYSGDYSKNKSVQSHDNSNVEETDSCCVM
jgi:hypothetical protein